MVFGLALELGLWAVGLLPTLRAGLTEPPRTDASWDLVFAGDSVTYGLDLPASASYPAQLGRRPALRDSGGEIYNLAQPGADLAGMRDQIEEFTRSHEPGRPFRVVLMGGFNDCNMIASPVGSAETFGAWTRGWLGLRRQLRRSRAYRLLTQLVMRGVLALDGRAVGQPEPLDEASTGRCRDHFAKEAARIDTLVRAAGGDLTFLTYAHADDPAETVRQVSLNVEILNGIVTAWARGVAVPSIDLMPCFREADAAALLPLFSLDGLHLSETGCSALAECLAAELPQLLPDESGAGDGRR